MARQKDSAHHSFNKMAAVSIFQKFLRFARFLLPYWKMQVLTIILSQVVICLGLINPYLTKLVIDGAYENRDLRLFIVLAILGGAVFLVSGLISSIVHYYSSYMKKRVNVDINKAVVSHVHSLGLAFFKDTSSGDNLYKVNYDIDRVTNLVTSSVEQALKVFPTFIFTLVIVFILNWPMGLVAFLSGIFFYMHAGFFARRRRAIQHRLIEQNQGIFKRLNEVFSKMYLVKAAGKGRHETRLHFKSLGEAMAIYFKSIKFQILSRLTSDIINKAIVGAIAFYGGYQVIRKGMSLGTLTAIMVYLSRITGFHNSVAGLFQNINIGLISSDRLQAILEKEGEQPEERKKITPKNLTPDIVFENVDFYYTPGKYVVRGFSMRILPGQWVGLAGASGCGKTTVLNLLLGLYYPTAGRILIEDILIRDIDLNFIRSNTGVVLQEPNLWDASIRENILYFNDTTCAKDVEKVVDEVMLAGAIREKPRGLDARLGDEACKFSEGQKQRLALARALLRRPKLLILDEALSFVDTETVMAVLEKIKKGYPEMAVLIITHNSHALSHTHRVEYMKEADAVVKDSHENLLKKDPDYRRLFNIRF